MEEKFLPYRASLKAIFKKGSSYLFLKDAEEGFLDFPGGRINTDERDVPLEKVLRREIAEEIGAKVRYGLGKPVFQYRAAKNGTDVLITVYEAKYISGDIVLSSEHSDAVWLDPGVFKFRTRDFLSPEGYRALKKYLNI
ncbi:MAG: NUDIX domain-containing protein [Candidatus Pacebacteria bacterium]|jgi:8-oxo-dGTP pyrophosphatase MutT (NUDIX family)|nr:NUDIX domain-containing protein [Candidatus Paceibacterota bacterium]